MGYVKFIATEKFKNFKIHRITPDEQLNDSPVVDYALYDGDKPQAVGTVKIFTDRREVAFIKNFQLDQILIEIENKTEMLSLLGAWFLVSALQDEILQKVMPYKWFALDTEKYSDVFENLGFGLVTTKNPYTFTCAAENLDAFAKQVTYEIPSGIRISSDKTEIKQAQGKILDILSKTYWGLTCGYNKEYLDDLIQYSSLYVAFNHENNPVGILRVVEDSDIFSVWDVVVHESMRKNNIAHKLIEVAIKNAIALNREDTKEKAVCMAMANPEDIQKMEKGLTAVTNRIDRPTNLSKLPDTVSNELILYLESISEKLSSKIPSHTYAYRL